MKVSKLNLKTLSKPHKNILITQKNYFLIVLFYFLDTPYKTNFVALELLCVKWEKLIKEQTLIKNTFISILKAQISEFYIESMFCVT